MWHLVLDDDDQAAVGLIQCNMFDVYACDVLGARRTPVEPRQFVVHAAYVSPSLSLPLCSTLCLCLSVPVALCPSASESAVLRIIA